MRSGRRAVHQFLLMFSIVFLVCFTVFSYSCYKIGYCDGNLEKEIEKYKQAIQNNPNDANAHSNLGTVYVTLERYEEAIEAYQQAIRIKPDNADAHYDLGIAYAKIGDKNAALDEYKILKNMDQALANKLYVEINK